MGCTGKRWLVRKDNGRGARPFVKLALYLLLINNAVGPGWGRKSRNTLIYKKLWLYSTPKTITMPVLFFFRARDRFFTGFVAIIAHLAISLPVMYTSLIVRFPYRVHGIRIE